MSSPYRPRAVRARWRFADMQKAQRKLLQQHAQASGKQRAELGELLDHLTRQIQQAWEEMPAGAKEPW